MQRLDGRLIVSAHDLVGFLGCEHVTVLDLEVAEEKREKPEYTEDPQLKLLQKRGFEHEARCLERLEAEGRTVREIQKAGFTLDTLEKAERETLAAMREGVAVVYQGTLLGDGRWRGHPDFLVRVERPSALGPWSYEPADAKLAQRVKAAALLQLCTYADRLETLQGVAPEHVHVVTGDGEMHPHRLADYGAYYRMVKRRFEERVFGDEDPPATYPDPVDHCGICRWWSDCTDRRRDDDHLCRVAGMSRLQTKRLVRASRAHADGSRHPPARRAKAGDRPPDAREAARAGAPAAGAVRRRGGPLRAHPPRPRGPRPGPGRPPRALAGRPLPRLRVGPVGLRGRPRVPDRDGRRGERQARLRHPLGPRPGRGEAGLREPDRHHPGAPRDAPGHARLPLRRLRGRGHQAPHGPLRHPRGGGGPPPARPRPRRPLLRRPPGRARLAGVVLAQEGREALHAAAGGPEDPPRLRPRRVREVAGAPGPAVDPGRPRRLQQGRLRLDLDDADLAGGPAEGSRGGIRDRARKAEGRGRRAHRRGGRAARGDAAGASRR